MIETEIEKARRLYETWSGRLCREKGFLENLLRYRKYTSQTLEQMLCAGVVRACTVCGSGPSGSCCFQGVEEWYDDVLLWINLLLGVELPDRRAIAGGCFFLGEKGCRLLARHAFCVNYLCPGLIDSLEASPKAEFLVVSGLELRWGWELEKNMHLWLKNRGGGDP